MQFHIVPVTQGMQENELRGRLRSGWVKVGRQVVQLLNPQISTPSNPNPGLSLQECDVWVLFEPTVPIAVVIGGLLQATGMGADANSLNLFCKTLFNKDITEMANDFGVPLTENINQEVPLGD